MAERFSSAEGAFIMRHHATSIRALAVACGLLASAGVAQAASETWVSGTGTDAGNCPITAPCRTFAFAHTQTNNNGAINVLTSGNFGPLIITKPISIVADGVEAVINAATGGAAITIAVGANAVVSLRGLTIDLRGTPNTGITFQAGGALRIQDCVIRKPGSAGIFFNPGSGTSELYVADTTIADNGASHGIFVFPVGTGSAKVTLDRVRLENAADGAGASFESGNASNPVTASMRDISASGNSGHGVRATASGGGSVSVMLDRVAAVNNPGNGVTALGAGAIIRIGDSTVAGNNAGLFAGDGGVIDSYGTNKVNGNSLDGTPTNTIDMK
jgi:hypothetical protein